MPNDVARSSNWVVVGASPSAPDHIAHAVARWPTPTTIACNGGAWLFGDNPPNYYWLCDTLSARNHGDDARRFQSDGSRLVTDRSRLRLIASGGVDSADVILDATKQRGPKPHTTFTPGQYTGGGVSGTWCLQFAVNNGARRVALVGLEGYRTGRGPVYRDHFHDTKHLSPCNMMAKITRLLIGPLTQNIITKCPDVEFVCYGKPTYPLVGDNLEVVA